MEAEYIITSSMSAVALSATLILSGFSGNLYKIRKLTTPIKRHLKKIVKNMTDPIDTEAGSLINIPNFIIRRSVFMSVNALFQAVTDILIEAMVILQFVSIKLPFRLEFLFLTLLSAVIAYLTLKGLREGDLDVTKNTLLVGLIVESSLLFGDIYLLLNTPLQSLLAIALVRVPFMLFTGANIYIIANIMLRNMKIRKARPNYQF